MWFVRPIEGKEPVRVCVNRAARPDSHAPRVVKGAVIYIYIYGAEGIYIGAM